MIHSMTSNLITEDSPLSPMHDVPGREKAAVPKAMLRGLKGGSGGGGGRGGGGSGGGGSYGGGGGGCYNCYNNSSGNGSESSNVAIVIVILVIVITLILVLVCCCISAKRTQEAAKERENNGDFNAKDTPNGNFNSLNDRVTHLKKEFDNYVSTEKSFDGPQSGKYLTAFIDRGNLRAGSASLTFTPLDNGRGYKISGKSVDSDGETIIHEGYVSNDGTHAWWREECVTGDVGMMVVNEGTFNFKENVMDHGRWTSSTGTSGSFTRFELVESAKDEESAMVPESAPTQEIIAQPVIPSTVVSEPVIDLSGGDGQPSAPPFSSNTSNNDGGTTTSNTNGGITSLFDAMYGNINKK